MTNDDLYQLDLWSGFPVEHRLRACLESHLSGHDHVEKVNALAKVLNYSRPHAVELWLGMASRIPIRHLPGIAAFIGVDLSVLAAFWLGEEGRTDEVADQLYEAAKPRITDAEFSLIATARAVYSDDDDDEGEEFLPAE